MERLPQQNRVIKFRTDAGFLTTVDVGQYFTLQTLENSHKLQNQCLVVEYTLPRDEKSSDRKGWIRGNTKIGPVLEVTTSYLQGKYGLEIGNDSIKQRPFSLVGQNFSRFKQLGHEFEQQRAENF